MTSVRSIVAIGLLILSILAVVSPGAESADSDGTGWERGLGARNVLSLDGTWKMSAFQYERQLPVNTGLDKGYASTGFDDSAWIDMPVPVDWFGHFWRKLSPQVRKLKPNFMTAWYRRWFDLPDSVPAGRLLLEFDAVDYLATVYVNGHEVGGHRGMWTPFRFDIADFVESGEKNLIAVRVVMDLSNFGGGLPHARGYRESRYLQFNLGGLHQSVRMRRVPPAYIEHVEVDPRVSVSRLDVRVETRNTGEQPMTVTWRAQVIGWDPDGRPQLPVVTHDGGPFVLPVDRGALAVTIPAQDLVTWDLDRPQLYWLRLTLQDGSRIIDDRYERFGYREFVARGKHFYLNGTMIYPMGACRVYVDMMDRDYANPQWMRQFIHDLKANNYNFLRLHAGPWPTWYHNLCDEVGFLSMPEWGHSGGPTFDEEFAEIRNWLRRNYNHPSVVMWSLQNESGGGEDCARRFRQFRALDRSGRPATASAGGNLFVPPTVHDTDIYDTHLYYGRGGYPVSFMIPAYQWLHKKVASYRGKVDRPFIITECNVVKGGALRRAKADSEVPQYPLDEYLKRIKRLKGTDRDSQIKMVPMASIYGVGPDEASWVASQFVKKLVEEFRIRDDLMQGVIPWQAHISQGEQNFQSVFVGTSMNYNDKGAFAGTSHKFKIHLRHYGPRPYENTRVDVWVRDLRGQERFKSEPLKLGTIKNGDRIDYDYECRIPEDVETGDYVLELRLRNHEVEISNNLYEMYILSKAGQHPRFSPRGAVAVLRPRGLNGPSAVNVPDVLERLGVRHRVIDDLDGLDKYQVLIVPAYYGTEPLVRKPLTVTGLSYFRTELHESFAELTRRQRRTWEQVYPQLAAAGARVEQWIRSGGRLLAFEQFVQGRVPWQNHFRISETGYNCFVDPIRRDHPVFEDFMVRDFADWGAERGVIVDYSIRPVNQNVLASVSTYGRGMAAAAAETRIGKGLSVLTQMNTIRRYGVDSVATHYVNQWLKYILSGQTWEGSRAEASIAKGERPAASFDPGQGHQAFISGPRQAAQSLRLVEVSHITSVELMLWRSKDPPGDLIIELRDDVDGEPGDRVLARAVRPRNSLPRRRGYPNWSNPWKIIPLSCRGLSRDNTYWIVAHTTGTDLFPDCYGWVLNASGYERGRGLASGDGGKTWQQASDSGPDFDFGFRVYGLGDEHVPK